MTTQTARLGEANGPRSSKPSVEDALVLSCDPTTAATIVRRLREAFVPEVHSDAADLNPYWPRNGASTFVDPDGNRLLIALM